MTCCPVVVFSCFLQIVKTVGKAIKMNAILNFTYNQFKYQGIEKSKKYILKDNFFCYIPSPAIRKEQQSYVFKYTNQYRAKGKQPQRARVGGSLHFIKAA